MIKVWKVGFSRLIDIEKLPDDHQLPSTLWAFCWYFIRQIKHLLLLAATLEAMVALSGAFVPLWLRWLVDGALQETRLGTDAIIWLAGTGMGILLFHWIAVLVLYRVYDFWYTPRFGNMMRRQLHAYVLGHSMSYFQNDYAGRVANKVLESGPALREVMRSLIGAVWYAGFFVGSAIWLMAASHILLIIPVLVWLAMYVLTLWVFVPQVQRLSAAHSEVHSTLVGRVVDSYTNIQTVKLFARRQHEDGYGMATLRWHTDSMGKVTGKVWYMRTVIETLNLLFLVGMGTVAVWLLLQGSISGGVLAMALPLAWQMTNQSSWIMHEVTNIFENLGRIQEGMDTIAKSHTVTNRAGAEPLTMKGGDIHFNGVSFHYGKGSGVMDHLELHIKPGEKVGLVGKSGSGKSTLVNLLLRFYDVEGGQILVDGQNISHVEQDTLREQVGMVTQDTSLLHRSIWDNIRYGRPDATDEEVIAAAKKAQAHDFILELTDHKGHTGYDAHVGERGVKLSGGQRQRIAIARVILKDAPILILDEATSALDSESEKAIQEALEAAMQGKTVIAIAHRLSTLDIMDRIAVMQDGAVIEQGKSSELLAQGGVYAKLWQMQSGGFLLE